MRTRFSAISLALALGACTTPVPPPTPPVDLTVEEQAIRAADSAWMTASVAREPAAEAAMFADDGVAYRGQAEPLNGPTAIQTYQTKYYADNPMSVVTWTTRSITIAASGDMAVQTGAFTEANSGPRGNTTIQGNFMTHWKKVNGQWKVAADFSAPNAPAPKTP
jgi:uncharacterized protein (TIGR02246 family)